MQDIALIYERLKDKYDLLYTSTAMLDDGYTIDVPVIRGAVGDRRFDLYKDGDFFVFSIELLDKTGDERYTHAHPYDVDDSIEFIEKFMLDKGVF